GPDPAPGHERAGLQGGERAGAVARLRPPRPRRRQPGQGRPRGPHPRTLTVTDPRARGDEEVSELLTMTGSYMVGTQLRKFSVGIFVLERHDPSGDYTCRVTSRELLESSPDSSISIFGVTPTQAVHLALELV